jgi:hypothetical protein
MWTKALYIHRVITQDRSTLKIDGYKMPRLSEAKRNWAIGMLQAGVSVIDVSKTFNCSRNTVHELVKQVMWMIVLGQVDQEQLANGTR